MVEVAPQGLEALAVYAREAAARGDVPATSGNFSLRDGPDRFLVSASGVDKKTLQAGDFLSVDLEGRPTTPGEPRRPSAETLLHAAVYRGRPAATCTLHLHPLAAVRASLNASAVIRLEGLELLKALEGITTHAATVEIPVFDNTQDMRQLAAHVDHWLAEARPGSHAFLIRGHGITVWGRTLQDAARHAEAYAYLLAL